MNGCDPPTVSDLLANWSLIRRHAADASRRLAAAGAEAVEVARATDWRADAARSFHARAEQARDDLVRLAWHAEMASGEVGEARARVAWRLWEGCG